jgi:hypothetical protein
MAVNPNDATEVVPYLTSSATIVFIQKWLKSREFYQKFVAAFPGADKYAHWFVAGIMSLIAAAGIHYVWTGSLNEGGQLVLTIPAVGVIIHGLSDVFKVYILQHTIYEGQPLRVPSQQQIFEQKQEEKK